MDYIQRSLLFDCYGALLTERQRDLLSQSIDEDCSLSEIAEREGISRQGVRDSLRKAEVQLQEYENALGMVEKRLKLEKCLRVLTQDVEHLDEKDPRVMKLIEDIRVMIDALEY